MTIQRILIAVDGSEDSVAAVRFGAELAAALPADVVVVHALGLLERLEVEEPTPAPELQARFRERCRDVWCRPLLDAQVPFRVEVRDGAPVPVILAVADEEEADLVVLGCRGLGGFPELLLGSTSTQVAQHARCPVTIVPGPGRRG